MYILSTLGDRVARLHDLCLVRLDSCPRIFLGGIVDIVILIRCLIIGKHRMLIIIFDIAIRLLYAQTVVEGNLRLRRIIFRIVYLLVTDCLDRWILCRKNSQSAVVECLVRLRFCISQHRLQILEHLIGKLVHKIGIDLAALLGLFDIDLFDPLIHLICERFLFFLRSNVALLLHLLKYFLAALRIFFGMADRIQSFRTLCDSGDHCALG